MQKIERLGSGLYKIISFIGLVLGFVILYFMIDMFLMVLATEPTLNSAFKAYFEWVYLYIGTISIFLIRHKSVIYINLIFLLVLVIYELVKKRKIGKECLVYLISSIYFIGTYTFLRRSLDITSTAELLNFVFSKIGVYINILTFGIFVILLTVTINGIKKSVISSHNNTNAEVTLCA